MKRTEEAELTVMVMVRKKGTDLVAVEERKKGHWDGLIFPGGHVEEGESLLEAAKREAEEETGLMISDVTFRGIVHWAHRAKKGRYLAFLYTAEGERGAPASNARRAQLLDAPAGVFGGGREVPRDG